MTLPIRKDQVAPVAVLGGSQIGASVHIPFLLCDPEVGGWNADTWPAEAHVFNASEVTRGDERWVTKEFPKSEREFPT